jgi:hypothetical protein
MFYHFEQCLQGAAVKILESFFFFESSTGEGETPPPEVNIIE